MTKSKQINLVEAFYLNDCQSHRASLGLSSREDNEPLSCKDLSCSEGCPLMPSRKGGEND